MSGKIGRKIMSDEWKIEPSSSELSKRVKKLEDQMGWIIARNIERGDNPKIQKMEIQINCLRKQVLDIEGKQQFKKKENKDV